jgi:hypothetical protein
MKPVLYTCINLISIDDRSKPYRACTRAKAALPIEEFRSLNLSHGEVVSGVCSRACDPCHHAPPPTLENFHRKIIRRDTSNPISARVLDLGKTPKCFHGFHRKTHQTLPIVTDSRLCSKPRHHHAISVVPSQMNALNPKP